MCSAARARDFNAAHSVAVVFMLLNGIGAHRLPEARPAGAGLKLLVGPEQLGIARYAPVDSIIMVAIERAGKRRLRALLPCNVVLLRRQLRPPLLVSLVDLLHLG